MTTMANSQAALLRDARIMARMTQRHLAEAAGVSVRTVMRAESGSDISDENARSLCAVLGLDVSALRQSEPELPASDSAALPQESEGSMAADGPLGQKLHAKLMGRVRRLPCWVSRALESCRIPALATAFVTGGICVGALDHMQASGQPEAYHLAEDVGTWAEKTTVGALQDYEKGGDVDRLVLQGDFSPHAREAYGALVRYEHEKAAQAGMDLDGFSNLTGEDPISQGIEDGRYTWKVRAWFWLWQKSKSGKSNYSDASVVVTVVQANTALHQLTITDIEPR